MKRSTLLILPFILMGCAAVDPIETLQDAQSRQSAADYAAEYRTQSILTIDGEPLENSFRTTVIKSGLNKKTAVFADEIVLLSELYERGEDKTLCTYGTTHDDVACISIKGNTRDASTLLSAFDEIGLFRFKVQESQHTMDDKNRACQLVEASLDPVALTPQNLDLLAEILGLEGEMTGEFPLLAMDISACFDAETGLALETRSDSTYAIDGTPMRIERSERIISITPPLTTEETFRVPE